MNKPIYSIFEHYGDAQHTDFPGTCQYAAPPASLVKMPSIFNFVDAGFSCSVLFSLGFFFLRFAWDIAKMRKRVKSFCSFGFFGIVDWTWMDFLRYPDCVRAYTWPGLLCTSKTSTACWSFPQSQFHYSSHTLYLYPSYS